MRQIDEIKSVDINNFAIFYQYLYSWKLITIFSGFSFPRRLNSSETTATLYTVRKQHSFFFSRYLGGLFVMHFSTSPASLGAPITQSNNNDGKKKISAQLRANNIASYCCYVKTRVSRALISRVPLLQDHREKKFFFLFSIPVNFVFVYLFTCYFYDRTGNFSDTIFVAVGISAYLFCCVPKKSVIIMRGICISIMHGHVSFSYIFAEKWSKRILESSNVNIYIYKYGYRVRAFASIEGNELLLFLSFRSLSLFFSIPSKISLFLQASKRISSLVFFFIVLTKKGNRTKDSSFFLKNDEEKLFSYTWSLYIPIIWQKLIYLFDDYKYGCIRAQMLFNSDDDKKKEGTILCIAANWEKCWIDTIDCFIMFTWFDFGD